MYNIDICLSQTQFRIERGKNQNKTTELNIKQQTRQKSKIKKYYSFQLKSDMPLLTLN